MACVKSVSINFLIGNTFLKRAVATLCYATHTLPLENLSENRAFPLIYSAPTLSIPVVARVQWANLARDAEVTRNLDHILTLFGIDLGPSTGLPSKQGQALKTSLRPVRFDVSQGKASADGWGRVRADILGLYSLAMTLPFPPVPTATANNSRTYGVPGQY